MKIEPRTTAISWVLIFGLMMLLTVGISLSMKTAFSQDKADSTKIALKITDIDTRIAELRKQQSEIVSSIQNLQQAALRIEGALIALQAIRADLDSTKVKTHQSP